MFVGVAGLWLLSNFSWRHVRLRLVATAFVLSLALLLGLRWLRGQGARGKGAAARWVAMEPQPLEPSQAPWVRGTACPRPRAGSARAPGGEAKGRAAPMGGMPTPAGARRDSGRGAPPGVEERRPAHGSIALPPTPHPPPG
jgi:hypothetical protein